MSNDNPNGNGAGLATIAPERGLQTQRLTADIDGARLMVQQVRELQASVLRPGVDFGVIPNTGDKPCLFKPGAETLLVTFNLGVAESIESIIPIEHEIPGHREYRLKLPIINRATGAVVGHGTGSCSTMESKYRFRNGQRVCPDCGKAAIIKGKEEFGGGWLCFKKKDGCGAKFQDGDPAIEEQVVGQIENTNPADQYNTCLKMAKKRALVDAALTTCAASGVFTQDVEENRDDNYDDAPRGQQQRAGQSQQRSNGNGQQQNRQQPQPEAPKLPEGPGQRLVLTNIKLGRSQPTERNPQGSEYFQAEARDAQGRIGKPVGIWHIDSFRKCAPDGKPEACQRLEIIADVLLTTKGDRTYYNLEAILPLGESAEPLEAEFTEMGPPMDMEGAPGFDPK